jgi:hypothetical protein
MAILQLSRITNRKGLIENLPQLAGAEFGWTLDARKLYIGNGTIEDGAPVIGNTEILTEFSNILELGSAYTYAGHRAGYVVATGPQDEAIVRSLQDKFDEVASAQDFGATGDGVTDDTVAINRALYELFCRELNPEIRRALYFPAGVYVITGPLWIPPHAKIYGDGITSSTFAYQSPDGGTTVAPYVIMTADSLQQTGANIGSNGAKAPTGIEMFSLQVTSEEDNTLLLLDSVTNSVFEKVSLNGSVIDFTIPGAEQSAVEIKSSTSAITSDIILSKVMMSGTTYGVTANGNSKGVIIENGKFEDHYIGARVGTNGAGPNGVIITRNVFDRVALQGIIMGPTGINGSAYNIFYDVGNNLSATPASSIISIEGSNAVSIGDLFERTDDDADVALGGKPRVNLLGNGGIAFDGSHSMLLGSYQRVVGVAATIPDDSSNTVFTFNNTLANSFKIDYTITRNNQTRMGWLYASNNGATVNYNEEFTDSTDIGVELVVIGYGTDSELVATTSATGTAATIEYSIVRMD